MPAGEQARRDGADIGDVLFVCIHKGRGGGSFEKRFLFLTPQSRELFIELTTEVASQLRRIASPAISHPFWPDHQ